jgi:hypothetical protein
VKHDEILLTPPGNWLFVVRELSWISVSLGTTSLRIFDQGGQVSLLLLLWNIFDVPFCVLFDPRLDEVEMERSDCRRGFRRDGVRPNILELILECASSSLSQVPVLPRP